MTIIGLQLGHNATACLLKNGVILAAASQEKFDNIKNSAAFPDDAIQWLLAEHNLTKVDAIAVAGIFVFPAQLSMLDSTGRTSATWQSWIRTGIEAVFARIMHYRVIHRAYWWYITNKNRLQAPQRQQELRERLTRYARNVIFVEHHVCHAYASYYSLMRDPNERALILTLDGSGDYYAATVNVAEKGRITRIASTPWMYSLGYIYSLTTKFLGMTPLEHEYKVMGLAPYAKEKYFTQVYERVFKPLLKLSSNNPLVFEGIIPTNRAMGYLRKQLIGERFDNVAGALQLLTENLITSWVRAALKATHTDTLYTGGGVFMNVKANMRVAEMPEVKQAYFMPSCGDESNPFGAAYYAYIEKTGATPEPLADIFLGPRYTNNEIKDYIRKERLDEKYSVSYHDNIEEKIAELLAEHKPVARFAGRAEWGARSLGNRAILAHPASLESFYEVNDAIKQRDFWMPFAPSILAEDSDTYISNPKHIPAPHMILGFQTTPLAKEHLRAAMHQADKTVRPQIVNDTNPSYQKLIRAFKQKTGIGAVMNTSFNLHGYPLVASLDQAFFTFSKSGLNYMALENTLISKR